MRYWAPTKLSVNRSWITLPLTSSTAPSLGNTSKTEFRRLVEPVLKRHHGDQRNTQIMRQYGSSFVLPLRDHQAPRGGVLNSDVVISEN